MTVLTDRINRTGLAQGPVAVAGEDFILSFVVVVVVQLHPFRLRNLVAVMFRQG